MPADRSLDAGYFEGIFTGTDDPWSLASSAYEAAKFAHAVDVLTDRRYDAALEIGCAHGVMTRRIAPLCADLLAIDISAAALDRARDRCSDLPQVRFERCAFPAEAPAETFDLIVLSEVVYYWSDADIRTAADWLRAQAAPGARVLLVHWTGETDYPQTGDGATTKLRDALGDAITIERAERKEHYRLDLWVRL